MIKWIVLHVVGRLSERVHKVINIRTNSKIKTLIRKTKKDCRFRMEQNGLQTGECVRVPRGRKEINRIVVKRFKRKKTIATDYYALVADRMCKGRGELCRVTWVY
jgi:hypothetical protein